MYYVYLLLSIVFILNTFPKLLLLTKLWDEINTITSPKKYVPTTNV